MKRACVCTALVVVAIAMPSVRADVKTTERSSTKFGGILGTMSRLMPGGGTSEMTTTVALRGDRRLSMNETNGEIVDLNEQKVYRLDLKRKEYKVLTFDQVRKEWLDTKADAEKHAKEMQEAQRDNPDAPPGKLEFTASVKETGRTKSLAGHNVREVVITLTGVQSGKTLEEGGGMVLTNTVWLAPTITAVDEISAFEMKYLKAILGSDDAAAVMQQMAMLFALFGNAKPAMDQLMAESRKLQGTQLASTLVMETVRSAEQAKAAAGNSQSSGGGGIGGMLSRRIAGRAAAADSSPRQTTFTTIREIQTVAPSASADDVAVPGGFREKK